MATINKDFKIKQGLIVEGSTATVAGNDILTKKQADQDYIIDLVGGSGTPINTPETLVLRDSNGDFAAGTITADLTGDVTGTVSSISNHDTDDLAEGSTNVYFTDGRAKDSAASLLTTATLNNITITGTGNGGLTITAENGIADSTTDDLDEGTNHLYFTDERVKNVLTGSTQTNIVIQEIAGELHITAENGVDDSTTDDLEEGTTNKYFTDSRARLTLSEGTGINYNNTSGEISADLGDFDTDDLTEGATNKYFSNTLARGAVSAGDGLDYNSTTGEFSADLKASGGLHIDASELAIDRTTVDAWYDAAGSATSAQAAAEATAALDATTKANNALSDANDYTDGEITTALTTAQGYANTAEQNANAYTDNAVSGLNWKQSVNLLYDAAIPTMSGSGASQLIIDGHDPLGDADSGYRILVTQSSNAGIHVFNSTSGNWTLTRAEDGDAFGELVGAAVYVMEGTQYGSTSWVQSNHYITDFTGQSWTQFSGQGSVTGGTGITVDGLEVSVNRTVVDTWYDAAGAASTAQNNAEDYVDNALTNYTATANLDTTIDGYGYLKSADLTGYATETYADNAASSAQDNAENYADSLASNYDPAGAATTAENNAKSYADGLAVNYDAAGSAMTAEQNANSYTDTEINALTTDDIEEGGTNHYYTDGRAKTAAANLLTNSILSNITITGDGDGLVITAENGVAGSTTDDLSEGTNNLYFTEARAQAAVAGDISSAINALDTDDVEEGTSNLYFTNQRAQDAVATDISTAISNGNSSASPTYQEINFTWATKQVGTYTWIPNSGSTAVYTWNGNSFPAAKFLVRVRAGQDSQVSEILVTKDDNGNVAMTEYAMVYTNGVLGDVTASFSNGTYTLTVNATNNSTEAIVAGTLLAYGD
jgi:hypothetical protein